jgi:hypothetical protein
VLANFTERDQKVPRHRLHDMGFEGELIDHLEGQTLDSWSDLQLDPYQTLWLEKVPEA